MEQIAVNQLVVGDIRRRGRGGNQTNVIPHHSTDNSGKKRVVGAAQNQGIDTFFFQGSKVFAGNTLQLRTCCLPSLDVLDEQRARLLEDSKTRNCSKSIDIGFRLNGCLSSNHANLAIVRCNDSSTRGRGHDLNDGNVLVHPVPFPRV